MGSHLSLDMPVSVATNCIEPLAGKAQHRRVVRRFRRYSVLVLVLITLGGGTWLERVTLLRGAAGLWIVSDPVTPADVVVVLGGGVDMRPFVAADLYTKGLVRKILISQVADLPAFSTDALPSDSEVSRRILRKLGVPDGAVELFGSENKNTWDEAVALKAWTQRHATSTVVIPVEPFFSRRASWIFQRQFSGTSVRIEIPSFDPPRVICPL